MLVNPTVYRHVQSTASATWDVAHYLAGNGGEGIPIVDVSVDLGSGLERIIPLTVEMIDSNNVRITFSQPRAGIAVIVV